jgi:hypothetical protein
VLFHPGRGLIVNSRSIIATREILTER